MDEEDERETGVDSREMPTESGRVRAKGASDASTGAARWTGRFATIAPAVTGPADAMRHDEMARSRALALVAVTGSLVTGLGAPFLPAGDLTFAILLGGLLLLSIANVALLYVAADSARYTENRLVGIWLTTSVGVFGVLVFFGPLSAATAVLVLGIYVAARNASRRVAWIAYLTLALPHAALVVLPLVTPLPELGVLVPTGFGVGGKLLVELSLQVVLAGTFAAASSSQVVMGRVLGDLETAAREIARRNVLLDEAREAFAHALPIGGVGRLTGAKLGSFELGVLIGRGGMAEIYEGVSENHGGVAAVKVLLPQSLGSEDQLTRFLREAKAVSSLSSEHVVRVLETGEPPTDLPYIAMERLHGEDLSTHLRERGAAMSAEQTVGLVRQIGRGLKAAREAGVVHRDVKPSNIYRTTGVNGAPVWKILDFGISKSRAVEGTLTHDGFIGTPSYMAPEQALGDEVDHRADLYSLGAVAYRCLVGQPPFCSGELVKVVYRVVRYMPARPSAHAELHEDVDLVLALALAKAPERRFESGEALADALESALRGALASPLREAAEAVLQERPWS